jgi:hypothetical protein
MTDRLEDGLAARDLTDQDWMVPPWQESSALSQLTARASIFSV